ncbi:hypothetical protein [Burkholderia pseudomallei]|uniref:hypothetical protein n=1 Tax=Burkholderia pseudomallei TaxID=28450 RepID=UPI00061C9799|nr:hypothetical protein [Burkholderia pseudomallei]MBO7881681.1 hypothetical protein [Burkholderia pseudomallei]CAJ9552234.1 Uncharacterised protein [Burkholderia pseudomallei]CPF10289.1 Uncharacterised protein [Burkholderia pseudomallei]
MDEAVDRKIVVGSDSEGLAGYAEQVGEVMAQDDTGLYLYGGHIHELRTARNGDVKFDRVRLSRVGMIVQDARRRGRYVAAVDKRGAAKVLPDALVTAAVDTFRDLAAEEGRIVHVQTKFPIMQRAANRQGWRAFTERDAGVHDGVLIRPGDRYSPVAGITSDADFKRSAGVVMNPFSEFPFADKRHRTLAFAAALMACTRPTMRTAPAVMIEAPIPRSGKTLLAEALGMLTPNRDDDMPIATSIPNTEDETEKKLAAFAGDSADAVLFDNLRAGLYSPSIEALITAGTVTVRPFGQNDATETREFRALLMFTGNNASVSDDLRRRALNIRLDAKTSRPQDVAHTFDPREEVTETRGAIAAAAIGMLDHVQQAADARREQWLRDVSPDFADLIAPAVRRACDLMPHAFEWPDAVVDEALADEGSAAIVETIIRGFVESPHLIEQAGTYMRVTDMLNMPPFDVVREMLESGPRAQRFNTVTLGRFLLKYRDNPSVLGTFRRVPKSARVKTEGWRVEFSDEFRGIVAEIDANNPA